MVVVIVSLLWSFSFDLAIGLSLSHFGWTALAQGRISKNFPLQ